MRLKQTAGADGNVGFQIAPMIDVVFVIMLFFMVMAGAVKVENELNTTLPGTAETSTSTDFVDEQIIAIAEDGTVSLNDEPFDDAKNTPPAAVDRHAHAPETKQRRGEIAVGGHDCQRTGGEIRPGHRRAQRVGGGPRSTT